MYFHVLAIFANMLTFLLNVQLKKTIFSFANSSSHKEDALCQVCKSLELTRAKFIVNDHPSASTTAGLLGASSTDSNSSSNFGFASGSRSVRLGPLWRIRISGFKCPFSRLVLHSLHGQPNSRLLTRDSDLDPTDAAHRREISNATCYASWQLDGREMIQENDSDSTTTRARTRRILLHWDQGGFPDSYVVLVTEQPWASSGLFLGRHVDSARTSPQLIKSWIELCQTDHGPLCAVEPGKEFKAMIAEPYFGVIDVNQMQLTQLPPGKRYVALSYTWGDGKPYTTTLDTIRPHTSPGGINRVYHKLPLVIQNAIDLVRKLDENYLWVDSLCIIQDSTVHWDLNAKNMHLVYGNAHLTICAADGKDSSEGLVGIDPAKRRFDQYIEEYSPDVQLMVSHIAETYIRRSKWNTRAWTFQERLLSKRCLIFTEGRVYFQCRSTAMSEDIVAGKQAGWSVELKDAPLQMLRQLQFRPIQVYMSSVALYTSRFLGRAGDVEAAFNGLGNRIGKALGGKLLFGLPNTHFDWALLWEPKDALQRRVIDGATPFPSWSWCGWSEQAIEYKPFMIGDCLVNLHEWLMEHTWIVWYVRTGQGSLRLVWDGTNYEDQMHSVEGRWKGYGRVPANQDDGVDEYGRRIKPDRKGHPRSEFSQILLEFPFNVSIVPKGTNPETKPPSSDRRFLQFWTWSAFLRLAPEEEAKSNGVGRKSKRFNILDYKGDWCGSIVLNRTWCRNVAPDVPYECIAISDAKDFASEECEHWTYYIPKEREDTDWDLFYVLLVQDEGTSSNIKNRIGLGKVFKEAFANSCAPGRGWREFILG